MSFRDPLPLKLSPRALQDFVDILRYTSETWSHNQLLVYRNKIDATLHAISRNPQIGHQRGDLPQMHMAYLVGSHIIIYRIDMDHVSVVRILHHRMCLVV